MPKRSSTPKHNHLFASAAYLGLLGALFTISCLQTGQSQTSAALAADAPSVLERLSARLHRSAGASISSEDALALLSDRADLMTHSTLVHLVSPDGSELIAMPIALQAYPTWIKIVASGNAASLTLDSEQMRMTIVGLTEGHLKAPRDCTLSAIAKDKYEVVRGTVDCIAVTGVTYDLDAAVEALGQALLSGSQDVTIQLTEAGGQLHTDAALNMQFPDLLATGRSNFKGSPWGRAKNVHTAIDKHINNVVVPVDGEMSFNDLLGPPVTQGNGWAMALGIFEGGALRMTPGGGICQTSTTVYRALLNAGLPIVSQRNHSLFVHYYEAHGVGLDATIFYNHQNLIFKNDTGQPIMLQAYVEGDDVTVNVYGTNDGRQTVLKGPFVPGNSADILHKGRPLRNNEIAWKRFITKADGTQSEELLVSSYKSVPNYVRKGILDGTLSGQ